MRLPHDRRPISVRSDLTCMYVFVTVTSALIHSGTFFFLFPLSPRARSFVIRSSAVSSVGK